MRIFKTFNRQKVQLCESQRVIGVQGTNSGILDPPQHDVFRSAVSGLSTGGTLLVVSEGPDRLHRNCCRQLLGSSDERRLRTLGIAGAIDASDDGLADRLPEGETRSPSDLRVVYNDLPSRGVVAHEVNSTPNGAEPEGPMAGDSNGPDQKNSTKTVLTNATLGEFGQAIEEAVTELSQTVGGDPADGVLRVCVDDIATLVDIDDAATVAQFLHVLGTRVSSAGGLLHAHARLRPGSHPVRTLAPFVDGIVYLRLRDGPEMQWAMRDGPTSEWIPLDWITP